MLVEAVWNVRRSIPQDNVLSTAPDRLLSDFAGWIELSRSMRDARAKVLAVPGIVIEFEDSGEGR
jgi:hypothetical protein